jgi:hypothetical protein
VGHLLLNMIKTFTLYSVVLVLMLMLVKFRQGLAALQLFTLFFVALNLFVCNYIR